MNLAGVPIGGKDCVRGEPGLSWSLARARIDQRRGRLVIGEIYRRRWEEEKVFEEIKNILGERQAWGTSRATR